MKYTKEQLQDTLEVFEAMIEYGERQMECPFEDLLNNLDVGSGKQTIRAVLEQAISKMETVEQSSEVDDNGAKPCPFEKMLWKGEPSHNPDKGWICDYNGVRITRLGGRKLYGDLIKTHNHAIEYLKSTNNTRADPQTIEPIDGLEEAIDILEVHMADMGDMAVVLVAARAYLTLTKRGG